MIIVDDTPPSPTKSRNGQELDLPSTSQLQAAPPPPAYGAISTPSLYSPPPPPRHHSESYQLIPVWWEREREKSTLRRFLKALGMAFVLWLVISWLISIGRISFEGVNDMEYPIPGNVKLLECVEGSDWNGSKKSFPIGGHTYLYSATKVFELPVSADALFLNSLGALSTGVLHVVTSPLDSDVVRVTVDVHYYRPDVMEHTKVCHLKRLNHEFGVGIFTPRRYSNNIWEERPYFTVTVQFPESSHSALRVPAFETLMSNFGHVLGDLEGRLTFDSLSLTGSNGVITGESLSFKNGTLKSSNGAIRINTVSMDQGEICTSNGQIEGHYTSAGDMTLKTTNGHIKAQIEFGIAGKPSTLSMTTGNSYLEGAITSYASKSTITTRTSNGALHVQVLGIPVDSTLELDARTSNNMAEVSLPPEYEGSFALSTSNSVINVHEDGNVRDPMGMGRKRGFEYKNTGGKGTVAGNVYWDKKNSDRGRVKLGSSNGHLTLNF